MGPIQSIEWGQIRVANLKIEVHEDGVTVTLARRTYTPVLFQAGFAELDLPIPW